MIKIKREDFGIKTAEMPEEQKKFMNNMLDTMCDVVNKAMDGVLDKDGVEKKFNEINETLKAYDPQKFEQVIKDNEDLCSQVKSLGETIEKLKQKGMTPESINKFDERLNEMFESEKFKSLVDGTSKEAKGFDGFKLKDVSMGGNYAGTALITEQQDRIVTQVTSKKPHLRDFITTLQGDPNYPILAYQQIIDVDRTARYVSENGTLPETSFKLKEKTSEVRRVGNHIKISKRMLKCRPYVRSLILNMLPEGVLQQEDFGIMFGDGTGDNLEGITKMEGVHSIESIITESVVTGAAGSVKAVTATDNGVMVELANVHDLVVEGMMITFKGATTNTALNATFPVIKAGDRLLFLEGVSLTAAEATVDKMTFTVNNAAFKSVETPNSVDALETGIAVMTYGQFAPSVVVMNPITFNSIRTEKATDGNRLKLVEGMNGGFTIGGLPVVLYTGIPAGKYFIGDTRNGCYLVDYSSLTLDWADDVDTKLKNQVVLYAQEEIILAVYMPWAFAYGSISALKTAVTKPTA